jgi:23S rRNA-/tRNA-specific pseudouridylate synthase
LKKERSAGPSQRPDTPHVAASQVRAGDALLLTLAPLPPMEAAPEALPLDVVFEDDSVLVVNKAAHMVVHPSAGHAVRPSLDSIP